MENYLRLIQYAGLTIAAVAALLGAWALLSDWARRRGRLRRCPRCWYDMSAVQSLTCPECGRNARHESRLFRSRRRWFMFSVALLLLSLGAAGAGVRWIKEKTWPRRVPARLLIALLDPTTPVVPRSSYANTNRPPPKLPDEQQQITDELIRRAGLGLLSPAARRALAAHQFSGTTPLTFHTRARWPAGIPLRVVIGSNFDGVMPRELRAVPRIPGAQPVTYYSGGLEVHIVSQRWSGWAPGQIWWQSRDGNNMGSQSIGIPPPGAQQIVFDVTITENTTPIWRGTTTLAIDIAGDTADIIHPVRDPQIDASLRDSLKQHFELSPDTTALRLDRPALDSLVDVTCSLRIEFLHNSEVVAGASFRWHDNAEQRSRIKRIQEVTTPKPDSDVIGIPDPGTELWSRLEGDTTALASWMQNPDEWTIRIRPDEELALSNLNAAAYWAGSIEMPLRDAIGRLPKE